MRTNKGEKGFTLVELIIVAAIVGVIAAIGYPSYQESVRKSARTMGTASLMETLGRQEQYFVNNKQYSTNLMALGYPANGYYINTEGQAQATAAGSVYLIQLAAAPAATTTTFSLEAVPQNGQVTDACGTLILTHTGARSQSGTPTNCW